MQPFYEAEKIKYFGVIPPNEVTRKDLYTNYEVAQVLEMTKVVTIDNFLSTADNLSTSSEFITFITSIIPPSQVKLVTAKLMCYYTLAYNREMDTNHVHKFLTKMVDINNDKFTIIHLGAIVDTFLMFPNKNKKPIANSNTILSEIFEAPLGRFIEGASPNSNVLKNDAWLTMAVPSKKLEVLDYTPEYLELLKKNGYKMSLGSSFAESQYRDMLFGVDNIVKTLNTTKHRNRPLSYFIQMPKGGR